MRPADALNPGLQIALAWHPRDSRQALAALFELDARLERVVANAREAMLAQIRLAWWRERLDELGDAAAPSEPLLAELAETWGLAASRLQPLVDGWEARLIDGDPSAFAEGRAAALCAFALVAGVPDEAEPAGDVGRSWARWTANDQRVFNAPSNLPRKLRGLAVLGGLATRAAERGEPLLSGPGAAITAWRLGLLGR